MTKESFDRKVSFTFQLHDPEAGKMEKRWNSFREQDSEAAPPASNEVEVRTLCPPQSYGGRVGDIPTIAKEKQKQKGCGCCSPVAVLCSLILLIGIIVGSAVVIYRYLIIVRPRAITFDVTDVQLSGLDFGRDGQNGVSSRTTFVLVAHNPQKKIGVWYDNITANGETMGVNMGTANLSNIFQDRRSTMNIPVDLELDRVATNSSTRNAITAAQAEGNLPLEISVDIKGRSRIRSRTLNSFTSELHCTLRIDTRIATGSQLLDKSCNLRTKSSRPRLRFYI